METVDPILELASTQIATRAAAGRDLSLIGKLEHIHALSQVAVGDPSPGVRLTAAAAAADILSRYRLGKAAAKLDQAKRTEITSWFRGVDPSHNPGVFSVFACSDCPAGLAGIVGGLRDPRGDVRLGAAVGLMRLCTSVAVAADADLEATVVGFFSDTRHKPDALAQIARVCAAAGYLSAATPMARLDLSGTNGDIVNQAITVMDDWVQPLTGLWYSDGRDAGETNPSPSLGPGLVAFDDDGVVLNTGGAWKTRRSYPGKGGRRMHFRRVGAQAAAAAFQGDGRTWYGEVGAGLYAAIDGLVGVIDWPALVNGAQDADMAHLAAIGVSTLPDTSAGHRACAQLFALAADVDHAIEALERALSSKNNSPDTWLMLADAQWAKGEQKSAKANYARFAKKARKKDDPESMARAKARA